MYPRESMDPPGRGHHKSYLRMGSGTGMRHRMLTFLIGSHWRTFCGMSREEFLNRATATLDDLGYEYTLEEVDTTAGEKLMLGADDEADRITVKQPASFTVNVVTATSNPVVGYALKFFSTEEMREEMTAGASVVDIDGIDDENRPLIGALLAGVVDRSDRPPWKLTHHVGFRLAVLLRLKVRVLWKYWLDVDPDGHARPTRG